MALRHFTDTMGGATSKVVRRLPKEKPSWSGVRTPTGFNVQGPEASRSGALASETKSEGQHQNFGESPFVQTYQEHN